MSPDARTLDVYDRGAEAYADLEDSGDATARLDGFIAALPPGGHVLDLGCGPGQFAARMIAAGLRVDALDASAGMARVARARYGVKVRPGRFEDVTGEDLYDGIWAHFSLLHAPRAAFPGHLAALARALRPGGRLLIAMKLGSGEARDRRDRFYSYYTLAELETHLAEAGFVFLESETGKGTGFDGQPHDFAVITARLP